MAKYKTEDIRNIVLCGHGSAGKTTLLDRLLVTTGAVNAQPSVDAGTSICDFDPEEKEHKYTIEAAVTHFDHGGKHFNVIDAPGYPDFIGQTLGALRAVETAAIVVNAQSGIAVNTRCCFREAEKAGTGRMIIINRLDGDNVDFPGLIAAIQELWGKRCVPYNVPLGSGAAFRGVANCLNVPADTSGALLDPAEIHDALIESIVEVDEKATEQYFEGIQPEGADLDRLIALSVAAGSLVPIVCISAKTGVGIPELLDAFARCALPPTAIVRHGKKGDQAVEVKADPAGPLVAQVFKTRIDPFVQKISYLRVFSGSLKGGDTVAATGARKGLKLAQLFTVQADKTAPVESAAAGDIVAVPRHEGTRPSFPGPCIRSWKRTRPSGSIGTARPKSWS